jgi:hypothetical protein
MEKLVHCNAEFSEPRLIYIYNIANKQFRVVFTAKVFYELQRIVKFCE